MKMTNEYCIGSIKVRKVEYWIRAHVVQNDLSATIKAEMRNKLKTIRRAGISKSVLKLIDTTVYVHNFYSNYY